MTTAIRAASVSVVMVCLWSSKAQAIINPRFTPAEMVRQAARVVVLEVSPPREDELAARVVRVIKGRAPGGERVVFAIARGQEPAPEEVAAALEGAKSATAILFLSRRGERGDEDAPAGMLQVNTRWFAVVGGEGNWRLAKDTRDMFSVWAGSAAMLARAAQYVMEDPGAAFPVKSLLAWDNDVVLGRMSAAAACLWVALDGSGTAVLVLGEPADRIYRWNGGAAAEVRLPGASKLACPVDIDGDDRPDLMCWDGRALRAMLRRADGSWTAAGEGMAMEQCLSLDAIDAGTGAGVVAGTPGGPRLIRCGADGALSVADSPARIAAEEQLGAAGPCIAADFDGDGICDIAQVMEGGLALWRGEGAGRFGPPAVAAVPVVRRPRSAVFGDYDADGKPDIIAGGSDGLALLLRDGSGRWHNVNAISGELAYHGNANQPEVAAVAACDINGDGRQGMALFYPRRSPLVFFNRGFACFGWAREVDFASSGEADANVPDPLAEPARPRLKSAEALQKGATAGATADLDGDGATDMAAVDRAGNVWAIRGRYEGGRGRVLTVRLSGRARGPLVVRAEDGGRLRGMYVLRPGLPVLVGREQGRAVSLRWMRRDGREHGRDVGPDENGPVEIEP